MALKKGIFTHPIIYANSIKRIKMFMSCLKAMSSDYGVNIDYDEIFTKDDDIKERLKKLHTKFAKAKIGVIGNVYCLQEGISINEVDGIVMIDPRSSGPAIIQIIGRPVRLDKNNKNKIAKILLPIILERYGDTIRVNNSYFDNTRDWVINICGADEDFNNLVIENLQIFSPESREGIEVREVLPSNPTTISGRFRILDRVEPQYQTINFDELKRNLEIKSFIDTKSSNEFKRNTEDGKNEYLRRQMLNYVIENKKKLETAIKDFNPKKLKKINKSKDEYILDFSQVNNIEKEKSEELLMSYDDFNIMVGLSNKLKDMNIKAAFQSMK